MGASFGGTCPLSEPPETVQTWISISRMKEAGMTHEMILGMAAFVVSIGAVLYVRLRRPAYAVVRRASREQSRVR